MVWCPGATLNMGQTLWLARHGNRQDFVDPNWRATARRPHDPPLSVDGVEQAKALAQRLRSEPIDYIFVSPYWRTVETAFQVAQVLDLPIHLEAGLGEHLNPSWFTDNPQLMRREELVKPFPRIDLTYRDRITPTFPETWQECYQRVAHTIHHLIDDYGDNVLIIGHGASVMGAVNALVGKRLDIPCRLCALFKLVREGDRWQLELSGDTTHLDASESVVRFN